MATNFPTAIDTFPSSATLAGQSLFTTPHSVLHGNLGDSLAAVQTKLGVNNSAVTSSVDYQLNSARSVQGRLTLTSGTPVTTSDVTGATTVYFAPYKGNKISLYSTGTSIWTYYTFSQISASLSGLTSGIPTDVFAYWTGSAVALELVNWTNGTTRATALTTQSGTYVKSGDATRLYLGTVCGSGAGTCEDSILKRFVYNYYNQVDRKLSAFDSTASWTYITSAYRAMNNNTANRLQLISGTGEEVLDCICVGTTSYTAGGDPFVGVGIDTTGGNSSEWQTTFALVNVSFSIFSSLRTVPPVGFHYYQALEYGVGTGTETWYGSSQLGGISGRYRG